MCACVCVCARARVGVFVCVCMRAKSASAAAGVYVYQQQLQLVYGYIHMIMCTFRMWYLHGGVLDPCNQRGGCAISSARGGAGLLHAARRFGLGQRPAVCNNNNMLPNPPNLGM